jgi:hypothetical protein
MNNKNSPNSIFSQHKQLLLHRYWELPEEGQAEILDTLAVADQSQVGFKKYVDSLDWENRDDMNRLAGLWDLVDEEHPEGLHKGGNPFRVPKA